MESFKKQPALFPEIEMVKSVLVLLPFNTDQTRIDILKIALGKTLEGFTPNDSSLRDHVTMLAPVIITKEKAMIRAHRSKWHANIGQFFNFNGGIPLKAEDFYFHKNTLCLRMSTISRYQKGAIIRERGNYYKHMKSTNSPSVDLHITLGTCDKSKIKGNLKLLSRLRNMQDYAHVFSKSFRFHTAHFVKNMNEGAKFERFASSQLQPATFDEL